jgi:hemerythrin-like domain-containing protein
MTHKSIVTLLDEHRAMLRTIRAVRLALLDGKVAAARQALDELKALHAAHIAAEEEEWIGRLQRNARWQPKVYLAEHAKLGDMIAQWHQRLHELAADALSAGERLDLLDATLPLQHLLEHHFEREEKGLFIEVAA